MIPKIIHYCWFGNNPKPKLAKKCIKSWARYCQNYKIIEWNEKNYDISSAPLYVQQAYEAKKWAFVTDFIRLDVVYRYGGLYLDTDVEILRPLDPFLNYKTFFGLEKASYVATGLGFGAEKGSKILQEMMDDYLKIPFIFPDGSYDLTPCPFRNSLVLRRHGLNDNDCNQLLDNDIHIFSSDVFSPIEYHSGELKKSKNTYTIHWFAESWHTKEEQIKHRKQIQKLHNQKLFRAFKMRIKIIIGPKNYEKLKRIIKHPHLLFL